MNQRGIAYKFIDDRHHPLMWVCQAGRLGAVMVTPLSECGDIVHVSYGDFSLLRKDTLVKFGLGDDAPGIEWSDFRITRWELAHAGNWLAEQAHHLLGGPLPRSSFMFDEECWSIDCVRLGLKKHLQWIQSRPSEALARICQPRGGEVPVCISLVKKENDHG